MSNRYAECGRNLKGFIKSKYPFTKRVHSCFLKITYDLRYLIKHKRHFLTLFFSVVRNYTALRWLKYQMKRDDSARQIIAINLIEHFGDIVACEPVSRYVRRLYPTAYIVWCVREPYQELIVSNPFVDQVVIVHCLTEWIALTKSNLFNEIIDLHIQHRVCPTCRLPLHKTKGSSHITLENYYCFGSLLPVFSTVAGLPPLNDQPLVYISSEIRANVDGLQLPDKFIVIHCSSNEVSRDWEQKKWIELVEQLTEKLQCNVVEVGSNALVNSGFHHYLNLCGKLSLLETAEVIARAKLFIGIDSGPAQLANAVGTYGIILLGHYRAFKRYLPYSGNFTKSTGASLLYADGPAAAISVERVYQTVKRRWDLEAA